MLSASLRTCSSQFDDDLNQFLLPGFVSLAVAARQRVSKSISATAEMENILNHQYYVALTPLPKTGEPRLWRSWDYGGSSIRLHIPVPSNRFATIR
jgi:hypothetical protein